MNTNLKVFVLDYYQTMTRILINFLKRLGFTDVECLKNGVEAFEKLNQSFFDLIIANWDMQPKTGIELLRKVQASDTLKHLQFIIVTTESKTLNIIAARDTSASNYNVKPFYGDSLKEKLDSMAASAA